MWKVTHMRGVRAASFGILSALVSVSLIAAHPTDAGALVTGWSGPYVTGLPSVNTQNSLFCLSRTSCVADSYYSAGADGSQISAYDGAGWAVTYTNTAYRCGGCIGPVMSSLQCLSAALCHALDNQGDFLTYDGVHWTASFVNSDLYWGALSCPTASFCMAGDAFGNAWSYNGTSWSGPTFISASVQPVSNSGSFPDAINQVSCPSASFCYAVDSSGYTIRFNGTRWGSPLKVASSNSGPISCPSRNFCAASDTTGDVMMYNGSSWTETNIDGNSYIPSLSCPTRSFCVAGDADGNIFFFNGVAWSSPAVLAPGNTIASISCPSARFCVAGDSSGGVFFYKD